MTSTAAPGKTEPVQENLTQKLMVSGYLGGKDNFTSCNEVRRGMPILSVEGEEVGRVAAVIVEGDSVKASHVLLSRLPDEQGYWMISLDMIVEVREDKVQLSILANDVGALPRW